MSFNPSQVPLGPSAASIWGGASGEQLLITNPDTVNTVYIGNTNTISVGASNTIPLGPGQSVVIDGSQPVYGCAPAGTKATVIIPGGSSFFQPTTLANIGGARVFVQSTTPTGTIPLNSLWFNTSSSSLETWNGSAWVTQQFDAQQLIQVATITATQIQNATLTTTQIAAAAGILGTQIANATITSGNIAANTIVAANIAANTITAAQIAANTITAGQIAANTITANQIAAKSITNATLAAWATDGVVSQAAFHGLNMIPDPQFSNSGVNAARLADPITAGTWTLGSSQAQATNVNGSANILALLSSTSKPIWVNPGETYYYSITVNRSGTSINQIGIQFLGSTTITQSTTASGTNTLSGTFTVPSGWTQMYVRFFANSSATADVITWSNPVLQPATLFSPTITGGTITGGTITGGTINGSVFNGTNWIENSSGSFFYSGTPALGNLVLSMTQQTGFDAFGNAYGQGFRVYGPNSAAMNMLLTGSTPLLAMQPGGMAHVSSAGSLNSQGINTGAVNEVQLVVVTSGQESTNDDAALQLWSATADNTSPARAVIEFGGQAVAQFDRANLISAIQPGTTTTKETWHTGTLGNGWTGTLKYRLNGFNTVEVVAISLNGSANTNAIFFQLPTGYRPATTQVNPAFCTSLAYSGQVGVQCNASGQLSMLATTITNNYDFHHFISLDL